jgi:hypothetical protein
VDVLLLGNLQKTWDDVQALYGGVTDRHRELEEETCFRASVSSTEGKKEERVVLYGVPHGRLG